MQKYSLCALRALAAANGHRLARNDYCEAISRIFSAKFSWAFDYLGDRDYLPGAVILCRKVPAIQDSNREEIVATLNDLVLEQLATRPFASAMEIDYKGQLYVLANMEYLCFTRREDEMLQTAVPLFMARMLEAEAIGMPLGQDVLNRLHEIVIFPKEFLDS